MGMPRGIWRRVASMPLKVKGARALLPSWRVPYRLPTKGQDKDPGGNWRQINREPGRLEQNPQELLVPWQRQMGKQAAGGLPTALAGNDGHVTMCGPRMGEGP